MINKFKNILVRASHVWVFAWHTHVFIPTHTRTHPPTQCMLIQSHKITMKCRTLEIVHTQHTSYLLRVIRDVTTAFHSSTGIFRSIKTSIYGQRITIWLSVWKSDKISIIVDWLICLYIITNIPHTRSHWWLGLGLGSDKYIKK